MKRFKSPIGRLGLLLVAGAVVAALAGDAQAQPRGPRPGGPGPDQDEMMNRIVDRLDLNDEQKQQMRQLHEQHRQATEALREQVEAAHDRLSERIDAEVFDEAAIREAAAQFSQAQTELFVSRAKVQQELRKILTPEQYAQMQEMRDRHHEMRMRRPGGPGGEGLHHGHRGPAPQDG